MPRDIPACSRPATNRRVLLSARPAGIPEARHFTLDTAPVPEPGEGEILVRNIYLSVDPAQRGWAADVANYSRPVALGTPMRALAVGVVIASRHPDHAEGEFLYGFFGWQDYAVVTPPAVLHRCTQDLPLEAFAGLCGISGVAAYLALTRLGRPAAGDTLLVSTAAGAVGSCAGQIGRSLGCTTIGLTGSDEKVRRCRDTFGYDAAFNYRTGDLAAQIAGAAPQGVNIYFDNTGGAILDTALRQMAVGGRVVQCGTASVASWSPVPTGPRNEREILTRRLIWSGFVIFDHLDAYDEACEALAALWSDGRLDFVTDMQHGIEAAPSALAALYQGRNSGKSLIYIGD
ncbi:NADP-dependent oxidoreductase [Paracoccus sp. (in: a-proteobacteria)]|uniref:NADP-dependent oxidoreductase n=1 Tax=Paracoccus sp. TaxID=267 RepID=UPI003A838FC7